jgi:hypothetical protein
VHYETEVYRPAATSTAANDDSRLGMAFKVLTWIVLGFLMVVWAVVGFAFWLPQMVREMLGFSFALVNASLTRGSVEPAGDSMKEAINFYRRGFEMAYDAIMRPRQPSVGTPAKPSVSTERLVKEALWAAFVWWILLSILGLIDATPVALGRWIVTGAWLGAVDGLLVKFWMWLDALVASVSG